MEAQRAAEELELIQSMVKVHQTSEKEKSSKVAQHRGTRERRSERLHKLFQLRTRRKKNYNVTDRDLRQKTDSGNFGSISARKEAQEVSNLEIY